MTDPASPKSFWSKPERVERLLALNAEGLAASKIAEALNREFGASLSRNAVIGRLHRMGIKASPDELTQRRRAGGIEGREKRMEAEARAGKVRAAGRPAPLVRFRPSPLSRLPQNGFNRPTEAPMATGGLSLIELGPRHCRWPLGGYWADDATLRFCAEPVLEGAPGGVPYCPYHCRRAFGSISPNRQSDSLIPNFHPNQGVDQLWQKDRAAAANEPVPMRPAPRRPAMVGLGTIRAGQSR